MDVAAFERVYEAFGEFHSFFAPLFGRSESRDHSQNYLRALLVQSQDRRNAENLSESVGVPARAMQGFLTAAPWDWVTSPCFHTAPSGRSGKRWPCPAGELGIAALVWCRNNTGRPLGRERPVSPLVEGLFTTPVLLGRTDFQRDGEPWFPFQESHGQLSAIQCGDTVLIIDLERMPRPNSAIH